MALAIRSPSEPSAIATLRFTDNENHGRFSDYHFFPRDHRQCWRLGRDDVEKLLGFSDKTISSRHLQLNCIVYDEGTTAADVPAMLYARVIGRNETLLTRTCMGSHNDARPLTDDDGEVLLMVGDNIQLSPRVSVKCIKSQETRLDDHASWPDSAETNLFADRYLVTDRPVGRGGSASVFVAMKHPVWRQLACKVVCLGPYNGLPRADEKVRRVSDDVTPVKRHIDIAREYEILKGIQHPNIISIDKVICCTSNVYIFQELVTGGDLFSHVERHGGVLSEVQALVIVYQVVKAVDYLHSKSIAHRDLKPENILVTTCRDDARVVLTDFGQARSFRSAKDITAAPGFPRMTTNVGTFGYAAPEIYRTRKASGPLEHGYTQSVDIWAVGSLTGTCLSGEHFPEPPPESTAAKSSFYPDALSQSIDMGVMETSENWRGVTRRAKDFIRQCRNVDEGQRLTAKQALKHRWFTDGGYEQDLIDVYRHAVTDWKPCLVSSDQVEYIDTTQALREAVGSDDRSNGNSTRSLHFTGTATPLFSHSEKPPQRQPDEMVRMPSQDSKQTIQVESITSADLPPELPQLSRNLDAAPAVSKTGASTFVEMTNQLSIHQYQPPPLSLSQTQSPAPTFQAACIRKTQPSPCLTQSQATMIGASPRPPSVPLTRYREWVLDERRQQTMEEDFSSSCNPSSSKPAFNRLADMRFPPAPVLTGSLQKTVRH